MLVNSKTKISVKIPFLFCFDIHNVLFILFKLHNNKKIFIYQYKVQIMRVVFSENWGLDSTPLNLLAYLF
jgi:hypothetical protein